MLEKPIEDFVEDLIRQGRIHSVQYFVDGLFPSEGSEQNHDQGDDGEDDGSCQ